MPLPVFPKSRKWKSCNLPSPSQILTYKNGINKVRGTIIKHQKNTINKQALEKEIEQWHELVFMPADRKKGSMMAVYQENQKNQNQEILVSSENVNGHQFHNGLDYHNGSGNKQVENIVYHRSSNDKRARNDARNSHVLINSLKSNMRRGQKQTTKWTKKKIQDKSKLIATKNSGGTNKQGVINQPQNSSIRKIT